VGTWVAAARRTVVGWALSPGGLFVCACERESHCYSQCVIVGAGQEREIAWAPVGWRNCVDSEKPLVPPVGAATKPASAKNRPFSHALNPRKAREWFQTRAARSTVQLFWEAEGPSTCSRPQADRYGVTFYLPIDGGIFFCGEFPPAFFPLLSPPLGGERPRAKESTGMPDSQKKKKADDEMTTAVHRRSPTHAL
jgi:hypothetical protein